MRITEHQGADISATPWFAADTTPLTVVDERGSDLDLGNVTTPLLLADNRIAFFSAGSVVVIGDDGQVQERIGRTGSGPGEFRNGRLVRGVGDTLLMDDWENARVSFLVPGAGVIRSVPFTRQVGKIVFTLLGQGGRDTLLVGSGEGIGFLDPKSSSLLVPWYAGRLVASESSPTPFDTFPGYAIVPYAGSRVGQRYAGAGGSAAWLGRIAVVDKRTAEIRSRSADGALQLIIRLPGVRRATDPQTVALDVEREIAWLRTRSQVGEIRWDTTRIFNQLRKAPPGDSLPLIDRILTGADGVLWLKEGRYEFADSTWTWIGVNPDGSIAGRLSGSGRDPVVAFGTGAVLFKLEDEEGYTALKIYRFRR